MRQSLSTSAGVFEAEFDTGKLALLRFPRVAGDQSTPARPVIPPARSLQRELQQYFAGQRREFSTRVALRQGTAFQRKVWRSLQRIPYGETKTYGQIAREVGLPGAARAVGAACGRNPVPILVPCHRVVAANQKLGGFTGGLHWKKRLLALEARG